MTKVTDLHDKVRQSLQVILSAADNLHVINSMNPLPEWDADATECYNMIEKHVRKIDELLGEK